MVIFPLVLQPNGRWKLNGTCEYILKKLRHIQKAIMIQQHNPLPFATWHASAHELAKIAHRCVFETLIEGEMVIFKILKCARENAPGVSAHAYGSY